MGRPSKTAKKNSRRDAHREGPYSAAFVCVCIHSLCIEAWCKTVFVLYLQMTAAETTTNRAPKTEDCRRRRIKRTRERERSQVIDASRFCWMHVLSTSFFRCYCSGESVGGGGSKEAEDNNNNNNFKTSTTKEEKARQSRIQV